LNKFCNDLSQLEKHNPDAFPPKTAVGKFLLKLSPFFQFCTSANGIFALRIAIISVALWEPAVQHNTAWFYYTNKGLWALIMAQVCVIIIFFFLIFVLKWHFPFRLALRYMQVIK